ncbi:MAG TPA: hypothetical protein VFQ16_11650 [Burkholderiaceae bacterium]|nr:hypothetical protein [Burkholderiaceae bacterium]
MTTLKKSANLLLHIALIAAGHAGGAAAQSLDDARAAIRKGTVPGITIIPARSKAASAPYAAAPAASAAMAVVAPTSAGGTPGPAVRPSGPATPATQADGGFLSALPPPGGKPLTATKQLNAPDLGIALPASAPGGR